MNEQTQERRVGGYQWNGKQVWLSGENQQNYTSDYLAGVLTVKVRVYDTDADASGKVALIETPEDLADFYHGMVQHVRKCIEDGWSVKDSVDYNNLLNQIDE